MTDLRHAAEDFLMMAAKDEHGRRQFDPLFEAVTERRQSKGYSACGDLGHWVLFRLGFRFPWVNRAEHNGWRVGKNLSLLCSSVAGGSNPVARPPRLGREVDAGDILVVNVHDVAKSHVVVVLGPAVLEPRAVIRTAEYGQFDARYGRASGHIFERVIGPAQGSKPGLRLGSATLDSVLSLKGLAELDGDHVAEDSPIEYYERIASRQRILRRTQPTMKGTDVRWWQEELKSLRLEVGRIDDLFGAVTAEATGAFQASTGLEQTKEVAEDDWCAMLGWSPIYATADEPAPLGAE